MDRMHRKMAMLAGRIHRMMAMVEMVVVDGGKMDGWMADWLLVGWVGYSALYYFFLFAFLTCKTVQIPFHLLI